MLRVVDGDTVELPFGEIEERSGLVGIDTPEVYPEAEPYGPEATAYTEELLSSREVLVEIALEERDRYDRVLVYLYVEDPEGSWQYGGMRLEQVNYEIARAGYADVLTIAPNVQSCTSERCKKREQPVEGCWSTEPTPDTSQTSGQ